MARKKKEVEPGYNIYQCQLCTEHPQFEANGAFSAHLTDTHQMDAKAKYQKSMKAHIDAADWYQTDYEWTHDGVVFALQSVRNPRAHEDRDYWSQERPTTTR